jgi:hypothetical protein
VGLFIVVDLYLFTGVYMSSDLQLNIEFILKLCTPIVGGLAAAVTVLWRSMHRQMVNTETRVCTKLKECEDRHVERDMWTVSMSEKVGRLEGLMEGHEQAREDLKSLSDKVVLLLD